MCLARGCGTFSPRIVCDQHWALLPLDILRALHADTAGARSIGRVAAIGCLAMRESRSVTEEERRAINRFVVYE
jgi:hypothetical protein